ncbi:hypothetical protein ACMXYX_17815 (plasmid) [Neptuniibacter sp. QD72_48]|uniref:hypothetical protein n=1 Tax=Neptuniibacter sp. QD72_48 TaxID=3398214 RepID=UPI0039F5BDCA
MITKDDLPSSDFAQFILNLSERHNVEYVQTDLDRWCNKITELCDDEVVLDDIENLIIELSRQEVIHKGCCLPLIHGYLQERKANG